MSEPSAVARTTPLRQRMIEDMTVHNLSPTTRATYVGAVKKFSLLYGRSPAELGVENVRAYQVHRVEQKVAWATLNHTVSALRFRYGVTLGRPDLPERIPYARVPKTLPVVLSTSEVARFLDAVEDPVCRAAYHGLCDRHAHDGSHHVAHRAYRDRT